MGQEAIVLAGGLGKRLRPVVKDIPKPMAEVNGRPFLEYILKYLIKNGVKRVILAVGYKYEVIQDYLQNTNIFAELEIVFSIENKPLGTGGAILQALQHVKGEQVFIINGDTFFDIKLEDLKIFCLETTADLVFALKKVPYSDRYGGIVLSDENKVLDFTAKKVLKTSNLVINGGIYRIKKKFLEKFDFPLKFSLESDFFEPRISEIRAYGKIFDNAFIDIGIPEDFKRAQTLLRDEWSD